MSIYHDAGPSDDVLEAFTVPNAQDVRASGPRRVVKVTIGDVDLPAYLSDGCVYIQAPLPLVFEAFGEDLSEFVRDLEVGVSTARGTPLSLDGNGRAILIPPLASEGVVRSRRFDR
jgi:hypothetical protein